MTKGKGKTDAGMTPSNSKTAVKSYVKRMTSVYEEIASLTADLKEIATAAKNDGFDASLLKRWARAIVTEKTEKLAETAMMLQTIGEIVEPTLFDKLPDADASVHLATSDTTH